MDAIGYHIERIRRQRNWASVQIEERVWGYTEWGSGATIEIGTDFLLTGFHCYISAVAAVTGDFTFSSSGTSQVVYNKTNCRIGSNTADWSMDSDLVTVHSNKLTVAPSIAVPYLGHVKLIIIRDGGS